MGGGAAGSSASSIAGVGSDGAISTCSGNSLEDNSRRAERLGQARGQRVAQARGHGIENRSRGSLPSRVSLPNQAGRKRFQGGGSVSATATRNPRPRFKRPMMNTNSTTRTAPRRGTK